MPIQVNRALCNGCGMCVDVCLVNAIQLVNFRAEIDGKLCMQCETCMDICPKKAITNYTVITSQASIIPLPEDRIPKDCCIYPHNTTRKRCPRP